MTNVYTLEKTEGAIKNEQFRETFCTQETRGKQNRKKTHNNKNQKRFGMRTSPQNRVYNQAPTKDKQVMPLIRNSFLLLIIFVDNIKVTYLE